MSRVRVLNVPNQCNEADLRAHFARPVGGAAGSETAVPLEITDCRIVTKQDAMTGRKVSRMAFVGFRTAAAGARAIRLFDGTYVGAQKIRVEPAQSLAEQRLAQKQEQERKQAEREQRRKEWIERRRARGEQIDDDGNPLDPAARKGPVSELDRLKADFVESELKAKSGPGWSSELLVPTTSDQLAANAAAEEQRRLLEEAEAKEAEALEKQQQLGDVDDGDFLAALTDGTKAKDVGTVEIEKERELNPALVEAVEREEAAAAAGAPGPSTTGSSTAVAKARGKLTPAQKTALQSLRVRIGNVPYGATQTDVKRFIANLVGDVVEVHLPLTKDTRQPKGIAFVTFANGDAALRALEADGSILMGRLVRITAAEPDPYKLKHEERLAQEAAAKEAAAGQDGEAEGNVIGNNFKKEKLEKQKQKDGALMWNPLYVESATAVSKVAKSLGVTAGDVVNVEAGGAAVRAAVAEAHLTSEASRTLGNEGINFSAMEKASLTKGRSNTTILVKHMPEKMNVQQLSHMFAKFGQLDAVAAPSSNAFALLAFVHEGDAKIAFQRLAYKMISGKPLFLEWAPIGALNTDAVDETREEEEDIAAEMMKHAHRSANPAAAAAAAGASPKKGGDDDDDDDAPAGARRFRTAHDEDDDDDVTRGATSKKPAAASPMGDAAAAGKAHVDVATVYVTNLPFGISSAAFTEFLHSHCRKLATNPELVVKTSLLETKGRAYVTVADTATATYCIAKLHGRSIEGRAIGAELSRSTTTNLQPRAQGNAPTAAEPDDDAALAAKYGSSKAAAPAGPSGPSDRPQVPHGRNPLKVVVKNLPFEATERDLRQLFSSFSEVKSVRVPQKVGQFGAHHTNNHRGFGFVEFLSEAEAAKAMQTLANTHLYGRHLVLEYAKL